MTCLRYIRHIQLQLRVGEASVESVREFLWRAIRLLTFCDDYVSTLGRCYYYDVRLLGRT